MIHAPGRFLPRLTTLLALAVLAQSCSSGGSGTTLLPPGSINGLVMDVGTGVGVSGAAVSGGGKSTTTDARGYFSLNDLTAGPVTVSVSKDGFAPAFATPRASDKPESTLVQLKKQGPAQNYSPSAAKTLSQSTEAGPYAVIFAAGSLDTSDTNLKVSITPVDPTKESTVLPGSLVTGSSDVLFPVTFAEFSILDSSGNRVQLRSGQSATVELPIPPTLRATYPLGAKIHCYAFNPTTGAWDDFVDGTVRTSTVDGSTPVLAAAIKHFSWYGGAPQGNDCVDVYGTVVSAVDGTPLGNARVEATPGGTTYTDADGNFRVVAGVAASSSFFAYQTGYDVDGSLTGIKGAKYIEFGRVDEDLVGLVTRPCNTAAAAGALPPAGRRGGPDNRVRVKVGSIGKQAYEVQAILSGGSSGPGSIVVTVQSGLPGPDGKIMSPVAASGSKITLSRQAASASLSEIAAGTGLYTLGTGASLAIEKGQTYLLTIDADGDGSIDGRGTVSVVGDLALTQPTPGGSYLASSFTASWTDTGTSLGGATYSAVYFLAISGRNATTAFSYQFGSGLSFTPYDLLGGPGTPLPPGDYTATLTGYSGFASSGSQNLQQSNNITGVGLTGTALSFDSVSSVDFTLR